MNKINKIFLHATYECNADCIHCAVPKQTGYITIQNFEKIVKEGVNNGLEYLIIGGGEPLLHPKLDKMVRIGYENDIKIKIETNGFLLSKNKLGKIKDYLFQINTSLDGIKAETHNKIRNLPTFERTVENVKNALNENIDVAVWSVVMNQNIGELEQLPELVAKIGGNKLSFLYATPVGNCFSNRDQILVSPSKYFSFFNKVYFQKEFDIQIRIAPYLIPNKEIEIFKEKTNGEFENECLMYNRELLHINHIGELYPCALLLNNQAVSLGNINNKRRLQETFKRSDSAWYKIENELNKLKHNTKRNLFNGTGCLGLCKTYNTEYDQRFNEGLPFCPSRTLNKEWNFG